VSGEHQTVRFREYLTGRPWQMITAVFSEGQKLGVCRLKYTKEGRVAFSTSHQQLGISADRVPFCFQLKTSNRSTCVSPHKYAFNKLRNKFSRLVPLKYHSYLTIKLDGDLFVTQWVAVTTHKGSTRVPPQNWPPPLYANIACDGQLLTGASVPPTIRVFGRDPQLPG